MDDYIPSSIRDSKWFMYPFYLYAYRGKNIQKAMNFKTLVQSMSESEYENFYQELDTISRNRETDLNEGCLEQILDRLDPNAKNLIDVGCGHGYLLQKIRARFPKIELYGTDLKAPSDSSGYNFLPGKFENLDLKPKSFDVVVCSHTIEHILHLEPFISRLIELARKQIIIVTPCQKEFYYTLDEHLHFFPTKEKLTSLFPLDDFYCEKLDGDWLFMAKLD